MSWEIIKLGQVIKHRKGFITIDDEKEYKLCRVQVHRRGVVLRETVKGIVIRTKKQQVCKSGDFLVAEMDAKVGGYGFVPEELEGAIVSSHYFLFELDETKIRPKFLEVICQLQILQNQIEAIGSTNYAAIRPVNVLNWNIPITDIQGQIKIEKLFDSVKYSGSNISTELTHQLTLVKKLRQQLLQDAVQGKLVKQNPDDEPASELLKKIKAEKEKLIAEKKIKKEKELPMIKGEEIPFEIPENWVWCRLGEICKLITSGSRNWNKYYSNEGELFIRSQNIKPTEIDLTKKAYVKLPASTEGKRTSVKLNDILITITGAGVSNTGHLTNIDFNVAYVSQHVALIRILDIKISKWIHFCIISEGIGKAQFSKLIYGDKPGLNLNQLSNLIIPIPPIAEQNRIVQKLDELMQHCNDLEASIKQSQSQNEKLLQQVLREALQSK